LPEAIDRCRLEPKDPVAFVEAVVTYHLIIEGYLALGGQRNTLRLLRKIGILPGFVAGFTAVARDESRHIGFGVLACGGASWRTRKWAGSLLASPRSRKSMLG
jgi:ribonucleoside-diphosphate reductase beta chain